jgi:signal transduction histidine kinase
MTFKSKLIAGFGIAMCLLIAVGVLSYRTMMRSDEDRVWVNHTHVVLEGLNAVSADVIDAEACQRGFLLTGEEVYLAPYRDALDRLVRDVKGVRDLTQDNPVQQAALDRLEPLLLTRLTEMRDRIETRRSRGAEQSGELVRLDSGEKHMDEIRAATGEMKQEERRLLARRTEESEASARLTRTTIVAGDALALICLVFAGLAVQQEMLKRQRAEEGVRKINDELERRVIERTAELDRRAAELARSNGELEQFAYVASHDLQEPLRMVASFTQLLERRYKDKLDADAKEFINYAVDGARRMQTLITDLLSFSRVGTQGKPMVATSCETVLKQVLGTLKLAIQESGAEITHEEMPEVMGDPQQLGQLFQNLIVNALKFRGEHAPRVDIRAVRGDGRWKISVRDHGIGISPEHAERIFVIFQRLHTRTEYPGTGIGLAVCKKIVERHGGAIWVTPAPGGGSMFNFTLEAAEVQKTEESEDYELRAASTAD